VSQGGSGAYHPGCLIPRANVTTRGITIQTSCVLILCSFHVSVFTKMVAFHAVFEIPKTQQIDRLLDTSNSCSNHRPEKETVRICPHSRSKTWLRIYVQLTDLISTPGDVCGGPCQYVSVTFDNTHVLMTQRPYVTHPNDGSSDKGLQTMPRRRCYVYTTRVATVVSSRHLSARLKNGAPCQHA
jgi:hypothetical protein